MYLILGRIPHKETSYNDLKYSYDIIKIVLNGIISRKYLSFVADFMLHITKVKKKSFLD